MSVPPTIRELAKLAGVSRTTVSLALRHDPRLSEATTEKVLNIAKAHGYSPDPLVSSLMNQLRTARKDRFVEKLAYLTFWREWRTNRNEVAYFNGACKRAGSLGYQVEHFWATDPAIGQARLSKILTARGIRGVLLAPLPKGLGHVTLAWKNFAGAALGLTVVKPGLHRATHGYYHGMALAVRSLKRRGYKRIGFANSALFDRRVNHAWLSAFLTYQYQIPEKFRVPPFLVEGWAVSNFADWVRIRESKTSPERTAFRDAFAKWIEKSRPEVILSNTDHPYVYLNDLGYRIPEDIGFAQLHRLTADDPWAGIDRLPELISAAAVDLVIGQLHNNEFGLPENPKTVTIEGVWRDGPSVRSGPME